MKKIIFILALTVSISNVFAGSFSETYVPQGILKSFYQSFPHIQKVLWKHLSNGQYEADFSFTRKYVNAFFNKNGKLMEVDVNIHWIDLPVSVRNYIVGNFSQCTIDNISVVELPHLENEYGIQIHKDGKHYEFIFNKQGDLVKTNLVVK